MALLAETLVDEWLNRKGYFTIRGLKHGVHEIDLLGIRQNSEMTEAIHVEVQVSMRPIGYISRLLSADVPSFAGSKSSAKTRPKEMLEPCVDAWVKKKFTSADKTLVRESRWPNCNWKLVFVHGVVKDEYELELIEKCGIKTIPLFKVLSELKHIPKGLTGGAGTDLAELIQYYTHHNIEV